MLLVLTNTEDSTASYLLDHLDREQLPYLRFNTDESLDALSFEYRCSGPKLIFKDKAFVPSDFHTVWYRRPERLKSKGFKDTPEDQYALDEWAEALEGFLAHIPSSSWINHPSANALASHKLHQLTIASQIGFQTPATLVTQSPAELRTFFKDCDGNVIAKPLSTGMLNASSCTPPALIYTNKVDEKELANLEDLLTCPTLFQRQINKQYDVRITIIDSHIHAVKLTAKDSDGSQRCDIRRNNMDDVGYGPCILPASVVDQLSQLMIQYRLRFGAIDMAVTLDDEWIFFEINPNGQWAWLDTCACAGISNSFLESIRAGFKA